MAKKRVLIAYRIPEEGLKSLLRDFELIYPDNEKFSEQEIIDYSKECEAIISVFGNKIPDEAIMNNSKLKIISNFGAGFDNINIPLATQHKILVTNTPDPVTEPTAELTVGLIISLLRRVAELDFSLKHRTDTKWGVMENLGHGLKGKKIGIIGLGKIGLSVAQKLQIFGAEIYYYKRNRLNEEEEIQKNIKYKSFEDIIQVSDIISLHTPLNDKTKHLIHRNNLIKMKPTSFLINTSRGPVVQEKDLVEALKNKQIAGAALDVFEFEPKITEELKSFKNVILVPHIGTATIDTRIEMGSVASQNIIDFFNNNLKSNIVNQELMQA